MSPVWLIGVMGAGKTAAGRAAATTLEVPFSDTDALVEERAGTSIAALWKAHGEEHFRRLEAEAVEMAGGGVGIVATGGGAVLSEANRAWMTGTVIWLTARPETITRRIDREGRPLLGEGSLDDEIRRITAERVPWYESVATHSIATDDLEVHQVAAEIVRLSAE